MLIASAAQLRHWRIKPLESHAPETNATAGTAEGKRRTTRIKKQFSIVVKGHDTLGEDFREAASTLEVSCHGFRYVAKRYISKGSSVTVEVSLPSNRLVRVAVGHVVWVQRPARYRHNFEINIEFENPQNIWDISDPPADWLEYSATEKLLDSKDAGRQGTGGVLDAGLGFASQNTSQQTGAKLNGIDFEEADDKSKNVSDKWLQDAILPAIHSCVGTVMRPALEASFQQLLDPLANAIAEKICPIISATLEAKIANLVKQEQKKTRNEAT